ncbi:NEDD8-activating enzyme E1 regulatory subunit [Aphelenchoides fujianensis]|nr:NEDD8-activating enzyme E1 regulatory subunit [Aphelenchoides fujianensis]
MTAGVADRYDRQVRLWGDQGQNSISEASIAVIGSSALATELLKSLVLAGIGSFEMFDTRVVRENDLGNNFFVTKEDLGKLRAEVVTRNLNELNPSVKGAFRDLEFTAESSLAVLDRFSLVVGVHLPADVAARIGDHLHEKNVPFIWTTIVGLVGYFRVVYREHEVLNDHREMPPHDFRLQKPFQSLLDYAATFDLAAMDHEQHAHVPFLVLYLKALEEWRERIGDPAALPLNYKTRKDFLDTLMGMQMLNEQGIYNEDNFAEAKQQVIRSFGGFQLNANLQKLFDDPRTEESAGEQTSSFWTYVSAIKAFFHTHGFLPLSGQLPDMTSSTVAYTQLLGIFRQQAAEEAQEVFGFAQRVRSSPKCRRTEITLEETQKFCRNASRLNAFTGTRLSDEFANGLMNFYAGKNRYPGTNGVPCALDSKDLLERVKNFAHETKDPEVIARWQQLVPVRAVEEWCRYGHAQLNATASIVGGIIAQEIIKLCTRQFIPVDNTFVFDGNTQNSASIRL